MKTRNEKMKMKKHYVGLYTGREMLLREKDFFVNVHIACHKIHERKIYFPI